MRTRDVFSRATGWTFVVLGGIGGIVCIALIVATWMSASRANDAVENLFDGASSLTTNVGAGVERASSQLESLRVSLAEGRERWKEAGGRISQEVLSIDPEWFAAVRTHLDSLREWLALVDAFRELAVVVEDSLRSFGILLNAEEPALEKVVEGVREGKVQVEQAIISVGEIEAAIHSIRTEEGKGEVSEKIGKAFERIDGTLEKLESSVDALENGIAELDQRMEELSKRIRGRIRLVAAVVTAFFSWQAVAQVCLLVVGWRLRSPAFRLP